jgi:NAD(P)-dependent dehydrogenase (short-subunit alcohol dehydrogenase family)
VVSAIVARLAACQWIGVPDDLMERSAHGGDMQLESTSVLVTGGSKGLGLALARRLAAAGARVVIVARDAGAVERAALSIRGAGGVAHGLAADVADKEAAHRIAAGAAALVGPIDVLVHNASALGPTPLRLLLDTDCEDLERALAVNLVGPFRLTKIVGGHMALRGRGVIVHVSSDAAATAYPSWGAYGASKAAQDHLSRILAAELDGSGVRVLAVDPGDMDTDLHRAAVPDADVASLQRPDDVAARLVAMIRDAARAPSGARLVAPEWSS